MNDKLIEKIFDKNPKATAVVQSWFMGKMLESLDDATIPEDFREMLREQGVKKEQLVKMIGGSPRSLFDVFDENNVIIQINAGKNFSYSINEGDTISGSWDSRKGAEYAAIEQAFEMLEKQL
jgi:hypothetical protein